MCPDSDSIHLEVPLTMHRTRMGAKCHSSLHLMALAAPVGQAFPANVDIGITTAPSSRRSVSYDPKQQPGMLPDRHVFGQLSKNSDAENA